MGIKGIYNEIGAGERIALSKLAVEFFENNDRPLRLAIDISIWLFQIQSSKGGTNPALRTFYYRLLRLISLSIYPLFVFDGPNKPPFKRNKRTGPNVASIPEFLAKQLLKQFGLPFHVAPGEAEAECALFQQEGIVDAVLSEDVDTLMFGSGLTLRNLSAEGTLKTKAATHVNLYDAQKTKDAAGLDREGMILVALMSGGDYIPEGIPGCGPKTACQAARGGFGKDLCQIRANDATGLAEWKQRLVHELRTNESKLFTRKHSSLIIPEDFPRRDIMRYYTHPCVSSESALARLRDSFQWEQDIDIQSLRTFTAEAFDWTCVSGAKKFIRNLAPALLVKQLRQRADFGQPMSDETYEIAQLENRLIKTIHLKRNHVSTDRISELRVGIVPIDLVPLDLDAEEPDPEDVAEDPDSGEEEIMGANDADGNEEPTSPRKRRGPYLYDPTKLEKIWILETFVKVGVPLKFEDWEEAFRDANKYEAMKALKKRTAQKHSKQSRTGGMSRGALDPFTKITKPGVNNLQNSSKELPLSISPVAANEKNASEPVLAPKPASRPKVAFKAPPKLGPLTPRKKQLGIIEILSSPDTGRRRSGLRRSHSDTSALSDAHQLQPHSAVDSNVSSTNRVHRSSLSYLDPLPELPPSVNMYRKRSPLRQLPASTKNTFNHAHFQTLDLTGAVTDSIPSEKVPPYALEYATTSVHALDTVQQPVTPSKKSHKSHVSRPDVITITSSPQTPRYRQKSITDWASPTKTPRASQCRKLSASGTGSSQAMEFKQRPTAETSNLTQPPSFKVPADYSSTLSIGSSAAATTSMPIRAARVTQHQLIRLRDSVPGAWGLINESQTAGDEDNQGTGSNPVSAQEKKRKRHIPEKQWRLSQVEKVDLTKT